MPVEPKAPRRKPDPAEKDLLLRLRVTCGVVILALLVVLLMIDSLGRLLVDPSFHVGDVTIGSLVGALLLLAGIEAAIRLPNILGRG